MDKNIKLSLSMDTNEATRKIKELGKTIQETKFNIKSPLGVDSEKSQIVDEALNSKSNVTEIVEELEKTTKAFEKNTSEILRYLKSQSNTDKKQSRETRKETTKKEKQTTKRESSKDTKDSDKLANILGAALGARAGFNYIKEGMAISKNLEIQSSEIFNRIGNYGSKYSKAKTDAKNLGSEYGYGTRDTLALQDKIMNEVGFTSNSNLFEDANNAMKLSRAYGLQTDQFTDIYGTLSRQGAYKENSSELSKTIATSIKTTGMVGRENEQMRAMQLLADNLTSRKLNITSDDFKELAGLHATLGKVNENLKGSKGAELIAQTNQSLNSSDQMLQRMVGYGGELGYGAEAKVTSKSLIEKGIGSKDFQDAFMRNYKQFGLQDRNVAKLVLSEKFGLKMDEIEPLLTAMENGQYYNLDEGSADLNEKIERFNKSDAKTYLQYDSNSEYGKSQWGDLANSALMPIRKGFNELPNGMQALTGLGGAVGGTILGGKLIGKIAPNLIGKLAGGLGTSTLNNGLGSVGANGLLKSGLSSTGLLSNALPWLPAVTGGISGVSDYTKGNYESGSEKIGGGLGSTAGLKLGSMIGSAIAPGLGTVIGGAVGGLAGGFLGGKAGRGIYGFTSGRSNVSEASAISTVDGSNVISKETDNIKRSSNIIDKQERLLKKEEELFDKYLGKNSQSSVIADDKFSASFTEADKGTFSDTGSSSTHVGSSGVVHGGSSGSFGSSSGSFSGTIGEGLGSASRKYEVGSNNGGFVSKGNTWGDPGGISYGIPQFSSTMGSAKEFVNSLMKSNPEYEKYFKGLSPGTSAFGTAWKQAYSDKGDEFEKLQLKYVQDKMYAPWVEQAKKLTGIDFTSSRALQEVAWSTAVQHGQNSAKKYLQGVSSSMSEKEIIELIYKNRDSLNSTTGSVRQSLSKRFASEKQDMLALVGNSPVESYAIGTPYISEDKMAYLHKEEAVLNKYEAKEYREGKLGYGSDSNINLNVNINAGDKVDPDLVNMIRNAVAQALSQINKPFDLSQSYERKPI